MLGTKLNINEYLDRFSLELKNLDRAAISRWSDALYSVWESANSVYIIGNGGSGTTASHFAEDLGKGSIPNDKFHDPGFKRLRVLSLTDNLGWIMAVGNDLSYDQIFLQQLMNYARPGDLLLAISGSGNSDNILNAVQWANQNQVKTFGLTGYDGGKLKAMQQDGLHVDLNDMGMVESIHLSAFHWVLNDFYRRINNPIDV